MTNQIIEVQDIAIVKTVNGVKKLFSLRNQKVKKGTLHDFGTGSGVKYQGDLYVLKGDAPELAPIVRMVTTKIDLLFSAGRSRDIEVDWGDGTRNRNVFRHSYTDGAGEHEVVFYGDNTALTILRCDGSQLTSLNVDNNTALTNLDCRSNQLTSLNVDNNTALTELCCYSNQLTSLNVDNNTALTNLICYFNQLTSLNVDNNTALTSLWCSNNQLTSLNVDNNTALTELYCGNNQLTSLNLTNNTALAILDSYSNNQLTSLNVDGCTALTNIYCRSNQLTSLNVDGCTALVGIDCLDNPFISDESALTALANSLPQRSMSDRGEIYINHPIWAGWIAAICNAKFWDVR